MQIPVSAGELKKIAVNDVIYRYSVGELAFDVYDADVRKRAFYLARYPRFVDKENRRTRFYSARFYHLIVVIWRIDVVIIRLDMTHKKRSAAHYYAKHDGHNYG